MFENFKKRRRIIDFILRLLNRFLGVHFWTLFCVNVKVLFIFRCSKNWQKKSAGNHLLNKRQKPTAERASVHPSVLDS